VTQEQQKQQHGCENLPLSQLKISHRPHSKSTPEVTYMIAAFPLSSCTRILLGAGYKNAVYIFDIQAYKNSLGS
jgi:hypothetical protein